MTPEQRVQFLEDKLDDTLMLLRTIVNYTATNNEDNEYLLDRIDEVYSEVLVDDGRGE